MRASVSIWGAIAAISFVVAAWTGSRSLLATDGAYFSPLYPSMGLLIGLAAMTVAAFGVERRRAERAGIETEKSHRLMVQTLLSLTGIRDAETGRHSKRTQKYTRVIAEELSKHPDFRDYLTPERVELMASLAPLHDIGKVGVPDRVLNKPGHLTPEELAEMRRHPTYGRDVIENAERAAGVRDDVALSVAKDIVYTHHEWWDGSGYPQGLRGTAIPIPGRVMAVVDVYDAIITRKLYQTPMSNDEAIAHIVRVEGIPFRSRRWLTHSSKSHPHCICSLRNLKASGFRFFLPGAWNPVAWNRIDSGNVPFHSPHECRRSYVGAAGRATRRAARSCAGTGGDAGVSRLPTGHLRATPQTGRTELVDDPSDVRRMGLQPARRNQPGQREPSATGVDGADQ